MLDPILALSEGHLRRLLGEYASYSHHDRIHDCFEKGRAAEGAAGAKAVRGSGGKLAPAHGGLHHHYTCAKRHKSLG
jgi:hypothetical protein